MHKFVSAAIASALLISVAVPTPSHAVFIAPPVGTAAGTSAAAGVGATAGFIGFVAALDLYDIIRRTTCSGDFLGLGGPGFGEQITPVMNVLPPQCVPPAKHRHRHRH